MSVWLCLFLPASVASSATSDIVLLKSMDLAAYNQAVAGFKASMPASTTITEYNLHGDLARGQALARKIRASGTTLVLAVGFKAALVAKMELPDLPIIFCMVLDHNRPDLTAPNLTGITMAVPLDRQLTTIQMTLPGRKRLGVLYDPAKTGSLVEKAGNVAKAMGLTLIARPVRTEQDVPSALRMLLRQTDALWLLPDSTVLTDDSLPFVMATALDENMPVIGFSSELARHGAVIGLSVHYADMGRQAGALAATILFGPGRSVPSSPDQFLLALNLKTAKFLSITLPPVIVQKADELH